MDPRGGRTTFVCTRRESAGDAAATDWGGAHVRQAADLTGLVSRSLPEPNGRGGGSRAVPQFRAVEQGPAIVGSPQRDAPFGLPSDSVQLADRGGEAPFDELETPGTTSRSYNQVTGRRRSAVEPLGTWVQDAASTTSHHAGRGGTDRPQVPLPAPTRSSTLVFPCRTKPGSMVGLSLGPKEGHGSKRILC